MADAPKSTPYFLFELTPDVVHHATAAANVALLHLRGQDLELPALLVTASLLVASYADAKGVPAVETLRCCEVMVKQFEQAARVERIMREVEQQAAAEAEAKKEGG